jgi:Protein of unknown function (DUF2934)
VYDASFVFGVQQENLREEESMPALTMKETPKPASTATETKLQNQIRRRAYELYEERGRDDGHALEDWLQAEIDITGNATRGATP